MDVPEEFNIPIKFFYQDDDSLTDEPERFQGQGPNIGYQLSSLPAGKTLKIKASLIFTDNIGNMSPQLFAKAIETQPQTHSTMTKQIAQVIHDHP